MKNIIQTAVENINTERSDAAIREAQGLLGAIEREQGLKAGHIKNVEENQKALAKVIESELTYEKVTGKPRPTTPTQSEETAIKAIDAIVKARQDEVQSRVNSLANCIAGLHDSVKACDKRIEELREKLLKVEPTVVVQSDIAPAA